MGYMGSGKTLIASLLAKKIALLHLDLDRYIEEKEQQSIAELFKNKGEIFFRKKESFYLTQLLQLKEPKILSLGGGTPCFGNNSEIIKNAPNTYSIYLAASIKTLTERLFKEKENRPLLSHLESKMALEDFIRKHLFERNFYYRQANLVVDIDDKSPEEIVEKLLVKLL